MFTVSNKQNGKWNALERLRKSKRVNSEVSLIGLFPPGSVGYWPDGYALEPWEMENLFYGDFVGYWPDGYRV